MNRRNFLGNLLTAAAGFSILPGATLYTRQWKPVRSVITLGWDIAVGEDYYCAAVLHNGIFVSFVNGPVHAWFDDNGNLLASKIKIETYDSVPAGWDTGAAWA